MQEIRLCPAFWPFAKVLIKISDSLQQGGYLARMAVPTVEFRTDKRFVRRERELKTIAAMIRIFCHKHGHSRTAALCGDCADLLDYATRRLERCVFGDAKPTCANCVVHCYTAEKREQIRHVMRWAGPRMLLRHPVLSIMHLLVDGRRPAPTLPAKPGNLRADASPKNEQAG
jgi:hypothetical protein